jgi:hypothetical protein
VHRTAPNGIALKGTLEAAFSAAIGLSTPKNSSQIDGAYQESEGES